MVEIIVDDSGASCVCMLAVCVQRRRPPEVAFIVSGFIYLLIMYLDI
jgi:hypothetical protein